MPKKKSANLQSRVTVAQAAEMFAVSPRSIHTAGKIRRNGSDELIAAVEAGKLTLNRAASVLSLPKHEQLAAAMNKAKRGTGDADANLQSRWNAVSAAINRAWKGAAEDDRRIIVMLLADKLAELRATLPQDSR